MDMSDTIAPLIAPILYDDFVKCAQPLLDAVPIVTDPPDVFLKAFLGMTDEEWIARENLRHYQNLLDTKMATFHEEFMGKFFGWRTLPAGEDLADVRLLKRAFNHKEARIGMEVINRTTDNLTKVRQTLIAFARSSNQAILVIINCDKTAIPRFDLPDSIEVIHGEEAYARLSGRDTYFHDLQQALRLFAQGQLIPK
jgi:hypothetical protein